MAQTKKYSDKVNNSRFEGNENLTAAELETRAEFDAAGGLGNYQKTNVEDMLNNFLISYVGEDKILKKIPRHEAAFWAQRAVQELSYDVLYSEKQIEFEISERLAFPLPADFINYVKVTWTDYQGQERTAHPARRATGKQAILQDDKFNHLYDQTGESLTAELSETLRRFQDPNTQLGSGSNASDFYYGNFDEDNYSYYYNIYFGRRYGLDPQFSYTNGSFVIDTYKGMIYLDPSFSRNGMNAGRGTSTTDTSLSNDNTIVSLRYISDGLAENNDLSKVYVHKMAEEAVYAQMLYGLAKVRPNAASLAGLYKKEASVATRTAKIRLMNLKTEEIAQVLRGRSKWIKH